MSSPETNERATVAESAAAADRAAAAESAAVVGEGASAPLLLRIDSLRVAIGDAQIIRNLSLDLCIGEVLGLVGASGSGKSMTALAIMQLLPSQARMGGTVYLAGTALTGQSEAQLQLVRGRDIGMVFQEPMTALNPSMKIGDQVAETVRLHQSGSASQARVMARDALDSVGLTGDQGALDRYPHELSGGQRQRVAIAMAVILRPSLLIVDEPTTALDVSAQAQILLLLSNLARTRRMGLILVSHDMAVIAQVTDRIAVLHQGEIVEQGATRETLRHLRHPYARALLAAAEPTPKRRSPVIDRSAVGLSTVAQSTAVSSSAVSWTAVLSSAVPPIAVPSTAVLSSAVPPIAVPSTAVPSSAVPSTAMLWSAVPPIAVLSTAVQSSGVPAIAVLSTSLLSDAEDSTAVLEARGIVREYAQRKRSFWRAAPVFRAVDGASLTVHRGENVGLVGESGSGKSSLLRAILGLERMQAGDVWLLGEAFSTARGADLRRLRRSIQAVFQDPYGSFDPQWSVERLIAEPFYLLDTPPTPAERRRRVAAALEQVGLSPADALRYPHEFSGGQRQRIAIARALITEPAVIVFDEAVSALDVLVRAQVLGLLAELSSRLQLAYLFVSHDLNVVRAIADRIYVMQQGRIVEEGATDDVFTSPQHPYTKALVAATPQIAGALNARA
jgi:peptide/nickel transport system ATP-binding protein